jgi:hypothetical protein
MVQGVSCFKFLILSHFIESLKMVVIDKTTYSFPFHLSPLLQQQLETHI